MRLKSRGLGRKELVMDFREYRVVRDGNEIVVSGTIHEPVTWDFSIRICEDDLAGLACVGLDTNMLGFLLRAALKRDRDHHWSQDRIEHIADANSRREAAQAKAARTGGLVDAAQGKTARTGGLVDAARAKVARVGGLVDAVQAKTVGGGSLVEAPQAKAVGERTLVDRQPISHNDAKVRS